MDFGYPQITDASVLKSLIFQKVRGAAGRAEWHGRRCERAGRGTDGDPPVNPVMTGRRQIGRRGRGAVATTEGERETASLARRRAGRACPVQRPLSAGDIPQGFVLESTKKKREAAAQNATLQVRVGYAAQLGRMQWPDLGGECNGDAACSFVVAAAVVELYQDMHQRCSEGGSRSTALCFHHSPGPLVPTHALAPFHPRSRARWDGGRRTSSTRRTRCSSMPSRP